MRKRILCALTALLLACPLMTHPALAAGAQGALTLACAREDDGIVLSVDGLDGKTNIYAVQLDLTLDGLHPDARLIPASADVQTPEKSATTENGKTHLTVYLDSQVPINEGKTLALGTLTASSTVPLPEKAELILLDLSLRKVAFAGAPAVSLPGGEDSGNTGGGDSGNTGGDAGNTGGDSGNTDSGNTGGGSTGGAGGGGGSSGGGGGASESTGSNETVSTGAQDQAVLTQKQLEKVKTLTVQSGKASVFLPESAVKALRQAGADVTLTLTADGAEGQSKTTRAQTGGAPVYAFSNAAGGKYVALGGGVQLTVPFTGKGTPVAYSLGANGNLSRMGALTVQNGSVTLELPSATAVAVLDIRHRFADVGGWYEGYVNTMAAKGVMSGLDEKTFAPQKNMTRAELVTTLARISGASLPEGAAAGFADVPANAWYAPYVAWAHENGVANGMTETTFAPGGALTREQLAVMLVRFAGMQGTTLSQEQQAAEFADAAAVSGYAADAVRLMQRSGIISGRGDGRFDPKGTATRAECAKMLAVLMEEL